MAKWKPCKRGESPKPKKSGIGPSSRKQIRDGNLRYNDRKGIWEKKEGN